jgi:hypothetical protein
MTRAKAMSDDEPKTDLVGVASERTKDINSIFARNPAWANEAVGLDNNESAGLYRL